MIILKNNLNIKRYVDTLEEAEINRDLGLQYIRELKLKIVDNEEKLNEYLGFERI